MRCFICSHLSCPSTDRSPQQTPSCPNPAPPKAGQHPLLVPSGVLPLVPFIPFLRGSCSPFPVPCGDSGLPQSKFRGVVGGVSRQEGSVGAVPALGARSLPSCSCWSFSWSCGSPVGCSQGQPLVAHSASGSAQPPREPWSSCRMIPRAAGGLSLTSGTSGVARASFYRRRKIPCVTSPPGAFHTLPTPHHPVCFAGGSSRNLGNSDTVRAGPGFPAQIPHPSFVARTVLGMLTATQEDTPGHVTAGGSLWRGTLGEHSSSCGPRDG